MLGENMPIFIIGSLNTENYQFAYGIDTTLLNLYSIEFGRIKHLSEKYNFFPLKVNQEEIEGLHITRFHRDTSDFSFLKLSPDFYLHSGANFSISQSSLYHYQECGKLFLKVNDSNGYPFHCNDLFCHSLSINRFNELLSLEAIDTFEMKLTYTGKSHCQIKIGYRALLNRHLPIKVKCYLNNREIMLLKDSLITFNITPNDELVIQSLHIRSDFGVDILMQGINIVAD